MYFISSLTVGAFVFLSITAPILPSLAYGLYVFGLCMAQWKTHKTCCYDLKEMGAENANPCV